MGKQTNYHCVCPFCAPNKPQSGVGSQEQGAKFSHGSSTKKTKLQVIYVR